jgi:hypothetical protein
MQGIEPWKKSTKTSWEGMNGDNSIKLFGINSIKVGEM